MSCGGLGRDSLRVAHEILRADDLPAARLDLAAVRVGVAPPLHLARSGRRRRHLALRHDAILVDVGALAAREPLLLARAHRHRLADDDALDVHRRVARPQEVDLLRQRHGERVDGRPRRDLRHGRLDRRQFHRLPRRLGAGLGDLDGFLRRPPHVFHRRQRCRREAPRPTRDHPHADAAVLVAESSSTPPFFIADALPLLAHQPRVHVVGARCLRRSQGLLH